MCETVFFFFAFLPSEWTVKSCEQLNVDTGISGDPFDGRANVHVEIYVSIFIVDAILNFFFF